MHLLETHTRLIDEIVDLLTSNRSILFITGAGISADSGLPTYRGIGGLYNVNETEEGLPIEVLLSGEMMQLRPDWTWKYLGQIEEAAREASFNRAHTVIAEMERHFDRVWTLTQNIDGFHRAAGAANVLEIHGDLHRLACTFCSHRRAVRDYREIRIPPNCPTCGSMIRPEVVLFGEALPEETLAALYEECERGFDLVFTIGTTSSFPYIAGPVQWASRAGTPTIEINPGHSRVSDIVDIQLPMRAAEALDEIWSRYHARLVDASKSSS